MRSSMGLGLALTLLCVMALSAVTFAQVQGRMHLDGDCEGLSCGNSTVLRQMFENSNCTGASIVYRGAAMNECRLDTLAPAPRYELVRRSSSGYERIIFLPSATSCDLSKPTETISTFVDTRTGYCIPADTSGGLYASHVEWKDAEEMLEANIAPFEPTPAGTNLELITYSGDGYNCDKKTGCGADKPTLFIWNTVTDCGEKKYADNVFPFMGYSVFGQCYVDTYGATVQTNLEIVCEDAAILTKKYSSTCDNEAGIKTIEKKLANVCVRTGSSSSSYIFCPTANITKAPTWKASEGKAPSSDAATLSFALASFLALLAALVVA